MSKSISTNKSTKKDKVNDNNSTTNDNAKENDILDAIEPASCFDKIKTRGRPKLKLNATGIKVVEALAMVGCTHEEIAACLNTTKDTLLAEHNNDAFSMASKNGREKGKMSLRRTQFKLAQESASMAIWLGKQLLGQSDNPEDGGDEDDKLNVIISFEDTSK